MVFISKECLGVAKAFFLLPNIPKNNCSPMNLRGGSG